ncbi:hypothetical protein [Alkaliphilus peptidifermentans]|uniref:hypothetical protein n=1 Tax=Alkaliphilus peptidifermentans TaxID=426129 RepID=UPI000B0C1AE2|nr:hypothetical protein [Alkaliphilus peptidifermentans]
MAWHIEAFARQKKMPKLDKILKVVKAKEEKKTGSRDLLKIAEKKGLKVPK